MYKILTPLLLKHEADASKKNRDGHTPLDLVKEGDQVTYLGYLVDDLHWSRWVLSGDVVAQCCLRPGEGGCVQNSYAPVAEARS